MKKNRLLLLLVVVLGSVTAYFVLNRKDSTMDQGLSDFAVKDTGSITKIFMADRTGAQATIIRKGPGKWELSDGSEARIDAVNTLLTCIRDIGIRSPVAKAAYNNVVKAIATKGIKVEIYNAQGLIKTYYVGGPTQDQMGTFMHLEGSTVPFITHIPGFTGYLTPRYITKVSDWKTHRVFNYIPSEISAVTAVDRQMEGFEIRIQKDEKGNYQVFGPGGKPVNNPNQDRVASYLQFFASINYEMPETSLSAQQRDSLLASVPFREVSVTGTDGRTRAIKMWRRPMTDATQNKTNASGDPFPFDIDRMTGRVEGDTALLVVQYFMMDKLFRKPGDFVVQ